HGARAGHPARPGAAGDGRGALALHPGDLEQPGRRGDRARGRAGRAHRARGALRAGLPARGPRARRRRALSALRAAAKVAATTWWAAAGLALWERCAVPRAAATPPAEDGTLVSVI